MKKSVVFIAGSFLSGFVVGGLVVCLLCGSAVRELQHIFRYNLYGEQEILARRAERENDYMRAFVHRWNVVDSLCEDGFRVFRPEFSEKFSGRLALPFLWMLKYTKCYQSGEMNLKFNRGLNRAQLALDMEKIGMEKAAKEQWDMACQLSSMDIDTLRNLVLKFRELNNSKKNIAGEQEVLGD